MAAEPGIDVLVVEDSAADARLFRLWLSKASGIHSLAFVSRGDEALAVLPGASESEGPRPPDLVVLDANLPDMSGWEVLTEIRQRPGLERCAVLMLSGSSTAADVQRARNLGAIGFRQKPFDFDDFTALVQWLEEFAARHGASGTQ